MKCVLLSAACLLFVGCGTTKSNTIRGLFVNKDLAYARVLSEHEKALFDQIFKLSPAPISLENETFLRPADELRSPMSFPYEYYISNGDGEPFHLYCMISDPPFFYGMVNFRSSSETVNMYSNKILRLTEGYVAQTSAVEIDDGISDKIAYLIYIEWKRTKPQSD